MSARHRRQSDAQATRSLRASTGDVPFDLEVHRTSLAGNMFLRIPRRIWCLCRYPELANQNGVDVRS